MLPSFKLKWWQHNDKFVLQESLSSLMCYGLFFAMIKVIVSDQALALCEKLS